MKMPRTPQEAESETTKWLWDRTTLAIQRSDSRTSSPPNSATGTAGTSTTLDEDLELKSRLKELVDLGVLTPGKSLEATHWQLLIRSGLVEVAGD